MTTSVQVKRCGLQRLIEMRNDENERTRAERSKRERKRQEKEMLRLNEQ